MQSLAILSSFVCVASAQLAAWPASSYSPYYQSVLGPFRTPVNAIPVLGQGVAPSAIPAPAPIAAPAFALSPPPVYEAPRPFAPVPAPLAAPYYAPLPAPAPFTAPYFSPFARVPEVFAPAVPAYAPFATRAFFIGSNKAKKD